MEQYFANPVGSFFGGANAAQQARRGQMDLQAAQSEMDRQNRLQALLVNHGAGLVNGDQSALEALAAAGFVDQAFDYRGQNHGIQMDLRNADQRDRQLGQADQSIQIDMANLELRRQEGQMRMAEFLNTQEAEARKEEIAAASAQAERAGQALWALYQQGPEAYEARSAQLWQSIGEDPVPYDAAPDGIAVLDGMGQAVNEWLSEQGGGDQSFIVSGEMAGEYGLPTDGTAFNITAGRSGVSASGIGGTGPRSSDTSAAEQEISRIMELTNPETGEPFSRQDAIRITDLYSTATDAYGQTYLVDKSTGEQIRPGQPQAPAQQAAPQSPAQQETTQQPDAAPALTYGESFQGGDNAFGAVGFGRRVANTAADVVNAPLPFPDTAAAQSDFRVLQDAILQTVSAGYDRQPPSWLMQSLRDLAPAAGSVWEGPQEAQNKLEALGRSLSGRLNGIERQLETPMSPNDATVLRQRAASIREGLGLVDQALAGIRGGVSLSADDNALIDQYLGGN